MWMLSSHPLKTVTCTCPSRGQSSEAIISAVTQIAFFVNRPGKGGSIALNRRDYFVNRPEKEGSVAVIANRERNDWFLMRNLTISRRSLDFDDVSLLQRAGRRRRAIMGAAATLPGPAAERAAASDGRRRRQPAANLAGLAQASGWLRSPPL